MKSKSVAILGATGAVGTETIRALLGIAKIQRITTFGRSPLQGFVDNRIKQNKIDIFEPSTYDKLIKGHDTAICTLGVGEPSKVDKETFVSIDKDAVLDFAKSCKEQGIEHFQLLSSVGTSAQSRSFYLRTKGELVDELKKLNFSRLSVFIPSMILTPTNRYGFSQAILLATWPIISLLLIGPLKKYKGIKIDELGSSIANNIIQLGSGYEELDWEDFQSINATEASK